MDLENKAPEEEKDKDKKPVEETAEKPVTEAEQPAPDDKQADENGEGADAQPEQAEQEAPAEETASEPEVKAEPAADPAAELEQLREENVRLKAQLEAHKAGFKGEYIEDAVLIGGIDYEENVVLPFVFSSMEPVGNGYFLGTVAEDDSILVYDRAFRLAFPRSYEKAEADDSGMLSLTVSDCVFDYYLGGDSPVLRRASMTSDICGVALQWRVANQVYLNDLNENDLLRINKIVTSYMLMLQESSFDELPAISASDYIAGLTKPGSFAGMAFDEISGFSFASADGNSAYDFSFTASYHLTDAEAEQMPGTAVQVQLRFRRNTDNKMILTSSNLNFQGAASAVTEPEDEGTE